MLSKEQSMFCKELLSYTNLYAIIEKFFVDNIKELPDIIDLSNDVDVPNFEQFLQQHCQLLSSSRTTLVYLYAFPNDQISLSFPGGRYVVKKFIRSSYEKDGGSLKIKGGLTSFNYFSEKLNYITFRHDNFAEMVGFFESTKLSFIVLKYYEDEDFSRRLDADPDMSWSTTLDILLQVSYIFYRIHSTEPKQPLRRVYCDFKLENILCESSRLRVCDLAAMRSEISDSVSTSSAPYQDPYNSGKGTTTKFDIYNVGLLIIQLVTNQPISRSGNEDPIRLPGNVPTPPTNVGLENLAEIISERLKDEGMLGLIRPRLSGICESPAGETVVTLALKCLNPVHENRPTARKIVDILRKIYSLIGMEELTDETYDVTLENY